MPGDFSLVLEAENIWMWSKCRCGCHGQRRILWSIENVDDAMGNVSGYMKYICAWDDGRRLSDARLGSAKN